MINAINIYNNLTYSLAIVIFLSTLTPSPKHRYVTTFILLTTTGLLMTSMQYWIMPVHVLVLTICFAETRKGIFKAFYISLTAIFLLWVFIITVSSITMIISPSWHGSDGFNLFIGAALLIATLTAKASRQQIDLHSRNESKGYIIALELVTIGFFSFVLPLFFRGIDIESARLWAVFALSLMLVMMIVALLINRMKDLEYRHRYLISQMDQQKSYADQVQKQFERIITLKHFYTKLYESLSPFIRDNNMESLRNYFETYITPIHEAQIQDNIQISKVNNELVRNLLDITAGQASTMESVSLDMAISGEIHPSDNIALDIFEIMSNLIDNAMREISNQENALLRIWLRQEESYLFIMIANSLSNDLEIEQLYKKPERGDSHGYGLIRVREIVNRYPDMEHMTYKGVMFEGKEVLTQQIKIMCEPKGGELPD